MLRRRRFSSLVFSLALAATVAVVPPSFAAEDSTSAETAKTSKAPKEEPWKWEGSKAEDVTAKGLDAVVIRPLAVARVALGAVLMIPASLFSAPSGREGFDSSYEVLLEVPMEYAFDRPLGQDF
jgi:hypothetical protein